MSLSSEKNTFNFWLAVFGAAVGFVSITLSIKQYYESKEVKKMQAELLQLQLDRAKADKAKMDAQAEAQIKNKS